jgi:hypothetical protein
MTAGASNAQLRSSFRWLLYRELKRLFQCSTKGNAAECYALDVTETYRTRRSEQNQPEVNAAGRGDFSQMDKFPPNKTIGGVRLPTNRNEVQRILKALAEKESPYERLYRTLARPS